MPQDAEKTEAVTSPEWELKLKGSVLTVKYGSASIPVTFLHNDPTKTGARVKDALKSLGASPGDIPKAMSRLTKLYEEQNTAAAVSQVKGGGEAFDFGHGKASPILDKPLMAIHPAIGLTDSFAYIGVPLPSTFTYQGRDGQQTSEVKDLPYIITSSRQILPLTPEGAHSLGLTLSSPPSLLRGKWSVDGIKSYLAGATADPRSVYLAVRAGFERHLEMDDGYYDLAALFTIGTYFFHVFVSFAYIYVMGVKRSGKTKLLDVFSLLAFNALKSANMSASSLFRLVQGGRATLLIDENEQLKNPERQQEMRSMLLGGYKKGSVVYRTEKDAQERFVPTPYEIYSPKVIANITGLEDVLEDRCIPLVMKRGLNDAIINSEVDDTDPAWQAIRDQLHVMFLDRAREIRELGEVLRREQHLRRVKARDRELWWPLYVLARYFEGLGVVPYGSDVSDVSAEGVLTGGGREENFNHQKNPPTPLPVYTPSSQTSLSTLIERLAEECTEDRQAEDLADTADVQLLQVLLREVVKNDWYANKSILAALKASMEEAPGWITSRWLGRALKRFGFKPKRFNTGKRYYMTPERVQDLAKRLSVTLPPDETNTEKCKTCDAWGGDASSNGALCCKRGVATPPDYMCDKWQPKKKAEAA